MKSEVNLGRLRNESKTGGGNAHHNRKSSHSCAEAVEALFEIDSKNSQMGISLPRLKNATNVNSKDSLVEGKANSESQTNNLKGLILSHLELIEEQQLQLREKDKEIEKLKSEKETLKCRLERIERRMNLAQKPINSTHKKEQPYQSPLKRKLGETEQSPIARKRQGGILSSGFLLQGGQSSPMFKPEITPPESKALKNSKFLTTEAFYSISYPKIETTVLVNPPTEDTVMLPTWKINEVTKLSSKNECLENLADHSFAQRHQKLEMDEKKRKRWDVQRIRELRQLEKFDRKSREKEMLKWAPQVTTFCHESPEVEIIEMAEKVPVIAFGHQLPALPTNEFSLPWFDVQSREKREKAKQRSKNLIGSRK